MNWNPKPHTWRQLKAVGREWCFRCGLVRLHNPATEWAVKMGCDHDEHPQYKAAMAQLTKETVR